jgi:hypothetical protein
MAAVHTQLWLRVVLGDVAFVTVGFNVVAAIVSVIIDISGSAGCVLARCCYSSKWRLLSLRGDGGCSGG